MSERVLFISPAKLYPVDKDGRPMQQVRQNVSLPALTVLGSLKSEGFEVDFMDLAADGYEERVPINKHVYRFGLPDEAVVQRISDIKPFALLITSMFSTEQMMVDDLAAKVKEAYPGLPIIVGGAHATLSPTWFPDPILMDGDIDFIVQGDGEDSAPRLLKELKSGNPELDKGVYFWKPQRTSEWMVSMETIKNLDRPWALDEVLLKDGNYRYNDNLSRRSRIYSHLTQPDWTKSFSLYYSRGCPMHCDYCATYKKDGPSVRHAGHKRMFNDFRLLHEKYGVNTFYNQADTFGFHPEDIKFLKKVKQYRKESPGFVLNNPNAFFAKIFFPASNNYELDEGLLNLLADSGFNVITIAAETFNQRFNKKIDFSKIPPEKINELFSAIHKKGMKTELYMMYAFPGQTREELYHDEKIVSTFSDVDEIAWQNCMVLPGADYYHKIVIGKVVDEDLFYEKKYRMVLAKGYFFHHMPEELNFSNIPNPELREFRSRHILNF